LACVAGLSSLTLLIYSRADATPLPKSSPLYNPAAPLLDENPEITAQYKGTITYLVEAPALETGGRYEKRSALLSWDEHVSGPIDQIEYTGIYGAKSIHWQITELTGSVKDEIIEGQSKSFCEGVFSSNTGSTKDGGEQGVFLPLDEPGHPAGGGNPATNPDYSVRPPGGMPVAHLLSSGPASTPCQTSSWNSTGSTAWGNPVAFFSSDPKVQAEWGNVVQPTVYFPPGSSHSQQLEFSHPCEPPTCGPESKVEGGKTTYYGKAVVTVKSGITFSSPELPGAKGGKRKPPRPLPAPCFGGRGPTCDDKLSALFDLLEGVSEMDGQCTLAVLTLGELAASVERGTTSLTEAESVSAMLAAGSDFACSMQVLSVLQDLKVINDPPTGGLRKLAQPTNPNVRAARLPSCRGGSGTARTFCLRLRTGELRYLAALRRGEAIDAALLTTVDRVSGAYRARNGSALKLQVRHATDLRAQLKAARGRGRAARRAIAALLRSDRVGVTLSVVQQQRGLGKALSKLHGVSQARLEQVAHVRLAAAPIDFVAQLSR
jgi:hypothetical protein